MGLITTVGGCVSCVDPPASACQAMPNDRMAIADTAFGRCANGMCMLVRAPCMMEAGGRLHTISSGGMHVGRLAELYVLSR